MEKQILQELENSIYEGSSSNVSLKINGKFELVDINGDTIAIPDGCEKYISTHFGNVNFGLKPIEKDTKLS